MAFSRLDAADKYNFLGQGADQVKFIYRGFTKYSRDDYVQWKAEGRLTHDGVNAKLNHNHGRLEAKQAASVNIFETPAMDKKTPLHGGV